MSVRVQTGAIEPIEVMALDLFGVQLTGATDLKLKVRRQSDGFLFDWSDDTFKAFPTTDSYPLTEIDATACPGEYMLTKTGHVGGFNTTTITNPSSDDTYAITVFQSPGTSASNMPQIGEVKVGQYVDDIPDFTENERTEIKTVLGITGTGTPNDSPTEGVMALTLGLMQNNFFLDSTIYNSAGLLTGGRIRIFPTKAATDLATDGGVGEGELAVFNITTISEISPLEAFAKTYKVTRE